MHTRLLNPDQVEIDGQTLQLPTVNASLNVNTNLTVVVDGIPFEAVQAIRILLAQREYLKTKIADLKSESK